MIGAHLHLPAGAWVSPWYAHLFSPPPIGLLNEVIGRSTRRVLLLTGKCVLHTTAKTGEVRVSEAAHPTCFKVTFGLDHSPRTGLTSRWVQGEVLRAHHGGANKVIVPWANRKDVELDVPKEVRARM